MKFPISWEQMNILINSAGGHENHCFGGGRGELDPRHL